MAYSKDRLDTLLLVVMRMVSKAYPDDLGYHVGMAMGQVSRDHRDHESQEHQQPGESRSYEVDGYRFSIKRDANGELEVQREETNHES